MDLRDAGLTDNEDKVYTALVELGPSLAGRISRKIGLHRRTVYDVTEMLVKKGLVGYILKFLVFYFSSHLQRLSLIFLHLSRLVPLPFCYNFPARILNLSE